MTEPIMVITRTAQRKKQKPLSTVATKGRHPMRPEPLGHSLIALIIPTIKPMPVPRQLTQIRTIAEICTSLLSFSGVSKSVSMIHIIPNISGTEMPKMRRLHRLRCGFSIAYPCLFNRKDSMKRGRCQRFGITPFLFYSRHTPQLTPSMVQPVLTQNFRPASEVSRQRQNWY